MARVFALATLLVWLIYFSIYWFMPPLDMAIPAGDDTWVEVLEEEDTRGQFFYFENGGISKYLEDAKEKRLKVVGLQLNNKPANIIHDYIAAFPKLKYLDIDSCHIRHLPKLSGWRRVLEKLTVTNCQLEDLPKDLENLKNLKYIDLSNNHLKEFPSLKNLTSLVYLDLSNNPNLGHTSLSDLTNNLYQLKTLKLSNNHLINFSINQFNDLETLDLSNNKLTSFPNLFPFCLKLNELRLEGNHINQEEIFTHNRQHPSLKIYHTNAEFRENGAIRLPK